MASGMVGPINRAKTDGKIVLEEERVGLLKREYIMSVVLDYKCMKST